MEFSKIESLAEILNEKNLTAIEVQEGDVRIRLESNHRIFSGESAQPLKKEKTPAEKGEKPPVKEEATAVDDDSKPEGTEVTSPLVGVVYLAPSPESEPYVSVGKKVSKGDVLCIVEAMKMLNEIAATEDGFISEICVQNEAVVDYGTCLFRISKEL